MPPNPAVGSNLGTYYDNDQGKGLATIIDTRSYYLNKEAKARQEAAKQKRKGDLSKRLGEMEEAIEVKFPEYINDFRDPFNALYDQAAVMITDANEDPWTSTSDRAKQWRANMRQVQKGVERVNLLHKDYTKAVDRINTHGDEYTDESKEAILNFPQQFNALDIIRGYRQEGDQQISASIPELKFRNPSLHQEFFRKGLTDLVPAKDENGYIPPEKIHNYGLSFFTDEANDRLRNAAQQNWEIISKNAPESVRKSVISYASMIGLENDPGVALEIMKLERAHAADPVNISEMALEIGKDLPQFSRETSVEDISGLTESSRTQEARRENAAQQADALLRTNSWWIDRPDIMSQLGIDRSQSGTRQETFNAAREALTDMIISNAPRRTEYGLARDRTAGSGLGAKEELANNELWWETLYTGTGIQPEDAAGFLAGAKIPGAGNVQNANVAFFNMSNPGMRVLSRIANTDRYIRIEFDTEKEANRMAEKFFKSKIKGLSPEDTFADTKEEAQDAKDQLEKFYMRNASNRVFILPISEMTKQQLLQYKIFSTKQKKQPYQPGFREERDVLEINVDE